ncbi:uncharacterized protein LOC144169422 [Haemaphysalis longicornis]
MQSLSWLSAVFIKRPLKNIMASSRGQPDNSSCLMLYAGAATTGVWRGGGGCELRRDACRSCVRAMASDNADSTGARWSSQATGLPESIRFTFEADRWQTIVEHFRIRFKSIKRSCLANVDWGATLFPACTHAISCTSVLWKI